VFAHLSKVIQGQANVSLLMTGSTLYIRVWSLKFYCI